MNKAKNVFEYIDKCIKDAKIMPKKQASQYITRIIPISLISKIKEIDSKERVNHFLKLGFKIDYVNMGSGGVGQIKTLWTKRETRIQLTYGQGMGNYANAIIIKY